MTRALALEYARPLVARRASAGVPASSASGTVASAMRRRRGARDVARASIHASVWRSCDGTFVRTYVRMMGPRPHRPVRDLEGAIQRGDLEMASTIARELARVRGRPIALELALELLPLVVAEDLGSYDAWAWRWLARWLDETRGASIESAAELAAALADLPSEPVTALAALRRARRGP